MQEVDRPLNSHSAGGLHHPWILSIPSSHRENPRWGRGSEGRALSQFYEFYYITIESPDLVKWRVIGAALMQIHADLWTANAHDLLNPLKTGARLMQIHAESRTRPARDRQQGPPPNFPRLPPATSTD